MTYSSGKSGMPTRLMKAVALFLAALSILACSARQAHPAARGPFIDTGGLPAELREAVDYVAARGYMDGGPEGMFHPERPVDRLQYARALVGLFGDGAEEPEPEPAIGDMNEGDPGYREAAIAVRNGYLQLFPDGTFRAGEAVPASDALKGLVTGLDLEEPVGHLRALYPGAPSYSGHVIAAHNLKLKYRNTRIKPGEAYTRAELAFSIMAADLVEGWRMNNLRKAFDWLSCQSPWVGPVRGRAMDSAFSKVGYPYVWGGESDSEGGYDCSGLVYFVLRDVLGYPMQRVADHQARDGRYPTVRREELLAGDPVFFYGSSAENPGYINHAGLYVGRGLFIHSTGSNSGVSVDALSGYWGDAFAWGKRVISEPEPETFDTYVLLMNPDAEPAEARLTYMIPDGVDHAHTVELEPYSRRTVKVDDTLMNHEVSTLVEVRSGRLFAERSMYFRYRDRHPGGHASTGVPRPGNLWYLAEGCTAHGFDTFILIQNPGREKASVKLTYMTDRGSSRDQEVVVGPRSRHTVAVDEVPGLGSSEFATTISSDRPVVVERSMYFEHGVSRGGHNSPGRAAPENEWHFAEGYTGPGFDTYLLVLNPGDDAARVTLTLMADDGEVTDVELEMPPRSRRTVSVGELRGWRDREFSAVVRSAAPVVAERAVYFDYGGATGGHNAPGVPFPARRWYLPEGYTAQGFDTYVLLSNPGDEEAAVEVRFMLKDGRFLEGVYTVAPMSRLTIPVDRIEGLEAEEVSTSVTSSRPVVAERAMYFSYGGLSGGSCSPGITGESDTWYFAEGFTGR